MADRDKVKSLLEKDLTFAEIGRRVGLTTERVRQLHKILFPAENPRDRVKRIRSKNRKIYKIKDVINLPKYGYLKKVIKEAKKKGIAVEPVYRYGKFLTRQLNAGGFRCVIKWSSKIAKVDRAVTSYYRFNIAVGIKGDFDYMIGVTPKDFYIVPWNMVKDKTTLYVRAKPAKDTYKDRFENSWVDSMEEYKNAWELLKQ